MIEDAAIRAEGQSVGDIKSAHRQRAKVIGIETVERALRLFRIDRIFHAADPETALTIAAPVIETVAPKLRLRLCQRSPLLRFEIIAPQAGFERQKHCAVAAEREGPNGFRQRPYAI